MGRLTKYSNDMIRNKAINIIRKLSDENGLNGDELSLVSAFCLIERTENKTLKEYEDLEEQGKLLKLPCAVGDTVYAIEVDEENFTHFHCPRKISEYKFNLQMLYLLGMFGKCIFLTREEAEAALKKLEG